MALKKNKILKNFTTIIMSLLKKSLDSVDIKKFSMIVELLESTFKKKKKDKFLYVVNGGSAAIANHYICDYLKLLRYNTKFKPKIISLVDNIETLTAISNDLDYSEVFKHQAES